MKSIRLIGIVIAISLAITACGGNSAEQTSVSTSSVVATTTINSNPTTAVTTTTRVPTPSTSASPTTTEQVTTTAAAEVEEEEIAFTSNLGDCDFESQPLPDPASPLGTIRIDKIDVDTPLLSGLRKEMEAPAFCIGSAEAGSIGFTVIGGHRTSGEGPFRRLPELKKGDIILLTIGSIEYKYEVQRDPQKFLATEAAKVMGETTTRNILKMFTCGPEEGETTHRWVVSAKLL